MTRELSDSPRCLPGTSDSIAASSAVDSVIIAIKPPGCQVENLPDYPSEMPVLKSGSSSVAERQLPKLNVAGSIPVSRSNPSNA
jgi:hypothetical protein